MANLYMDLFEACPLVPISGNESPLPSSVMLMNRALGGFIGRSTTVGTPTVGAGIVAGDLSDKKLVLRGRPGSFHNTRFVGSVFVTPNDTTAKIYIGAAVRFAPFSSGVAYEDRTLIGINSALRVTPGNSATASQFNNNAILLRSDGTISIGGEKSDSGIFPINTYKYVEAAFDPITGNVDLFIDGVLELQGNMSFSFIDSIGFVVAKGNDNVNSGYQLEIDNIYINDDTGDHYNGRMGPIDVQWAPLKSEDSVTWIPENAPNNITAVNKNTLDTGSFVRSPSQNDQADLYEIDTDDVDPNKVILGVVSAPYFRKTDIGARNLVAVATDGVTKIERTFTDANLDFAGSTTPLLMPTAPQGGAWDIDKLAACKFGYEVKA